MAASKSVRASRDGDQFHYYWAARRSLVLLSKKSGLVAITVEGVSGPDSAVSVEDSGEEVIDIAEYFGSEDPACATLIRYCQLKHSTEQSEDAWPPSGLRKTLSGFAKKFKDRLDAGEGNCTKSVEFCFISNRPISSEVLETVADISEGSELRHPRTLTKLIEFTTLEGEEFVAFIRSLKIQGGKESFLSQRSVLANETGMHLPGNDTDAPIRLKDLISRKATSEFLENPTITKEDVMRALGTTPEHIFPAPSRIEFSDKLIPREQEEEIAAEISMATDTVIVHAAGGVGKSMITHRIGTHLPSGSVVIVYDCFANGEYRRRSTPRHRHKDAIIQISNEIAANGLCLPLLRSAAADANDYLGAFWHRVKKAVEQIRAANEDAVLCIVIDAADNAEMEAREVGDRHSFAYDLLRDELPIGARLVILCRTERLTLLDPPPSTSAIELRSFSRTESASFLRFSYPDASESDVDEFHRLTSQNPRLQASALDQPGPLPDVLRSLGPNPQSVDDAIAGLLASAIKRIKHERNQVEKGSIDAICTALAVLRPLVPLAVLANLAGVSASAVRSFAVEIGRPLLVLDDSVQFRDEPVETWFRNEFRPISIELDGFIAKLQPLALSSAYVASTLPQLMLEAGKLEELIDLALTSESLPQASPIEKRDVEIQRLQFALKASLRAGLYPAAAKLALKAGVEAAGDDRQAELFQKNTDLVGLLIEPAHLQEIVARGHFAGKWLGSHFAYEASLLSNVSDFKGDARGRYRLAYEWLSNWSGLSREDKDKERIDDSDIAELVAARLNLDGPVACARELRRWSPREISFRVGRIVARRLVDQGRYTELDALSLAADSDFWLVLSINEALRAVQRVVPKEAVERTLRLMLSSHVKIEEDPSDYKSKVLRTVICIVEAACIHGLRSREELAALLDSQLPMEPPHALTTRYSVQRLPYLRAYALRAALRGRVVELIDLARPMIRKELENGGSGHTQDARELKEHVSAILPWVTIWAEALVSGMSLSDAKGRVDAIKAKGIGPNSYDANESRTIDEIAEVWLDIALSKGVGGIVLLDDLMSWAEGGKRTLFLPTWIRMAHGSARIDGLQGHAHRFLGHANGIVLGTREDAASMAASNVDMARAIFCADKHEAAEYFGRAIDVVSLLGDEVNDRWHAVLDLALRAQGSQAGAAERAYRLARCAEVVERYDSKHFDWERTVAALVGISGASSLAIFSRWEDRGFSRGVNLLSEIVGKLIEDGRLSAIAGCALVPMGHGWDYVTSLQSLCKATSDKSLRERAASFLIRYLRLDGATASTWKKLAAAALAGGVNFPEAAEIIDHLERLEKKPSREDHSYSSLTVNTDWDAVFQTSRLDTIEGLSESYARFRAGDPPYYAEDYFEEACTRIPAGGEADFIRCVGSNPLFDLYEFKALLQAVPGSWTQRLAIRTALADAVRRRCSIHCLEIDMNRYYQKLPLNVLSGHSGVTEAELIDLVLDAIGSKSEELSPRRLFMLLGLLAQRLTPEQAREGLDFGLSMFDTALEAEDGDGPWSSSLDPGDNVEDALAGMLWASLASPDSKRRWETAHAIVGLCELGYQAVVSKIVGMYELGGGAFADPRFHFYQLHARQWFLIALARAARGRPESVQPLTTFLKDLIESNMQHVVMRHFAADALQALERSDLTSIDSELSARLKNINRSPIEPTISKRYQRSRSQSKGGEREKRFLFGYDMSRYWFEPLADCFAMSSEEIEEQAEIVICEDWSLSHNGQWDTDVRARSGLFRDRESYHSHSSYPRKDDLRFYLSYHALMTTAGKLLASQAVHLDPEYPEDEFSDWLSWHMLTRDDGFWRADRRDPTPLEWRAWFNNPPENWRWSVQLHDFERVLGIKNEFINIWGRWTSSSDRNTERVHVSSALVARDAGHELIRSLQSAANPYDFSLPKADCHDDGSSRLVGWVIESDRESRLDQFDPWAGSVEYPPVRPGKQILDVFGLHSINDDRAWVVPGRNDPWFRAQLWGDNGSKHDESDSASGKRLQMQRQLLPTVLANLNMDLVIIVEIDRLKRRYAHNQREDDELAYVLPYFKVFLYRADGTCESANST